MFKMRTIKKFATLTALAAVLTINSITPVSAGAVGGSRSDSFRLFGRSIDTFNISFYGMEAASVAVVGDGDTDLDLYVYDQYGNLIAYDDSRGDNCVVSWTPRFTGRFTIKVVNRGSVYNDYGIATN